MAAALVRRMRQQHCLIPSRMALCSRKLGLGTRALTPGRLHRSVHVPSYTKNIDQLRSKGVDTIICVAVNDPYTLNAWAEVMKEKGKIDFYADFDGSFHKYLGLQCDLSKALLGLRSQRWSAFVDDGVVKVLKVEKAPSELEVTDGETMIKAIK